VFLLLNKLKLSTMDLFTENIMKQWGYSSEIINIFKEKEIDEMALLDLTETMVEQLFPKMGQRFKFLKHLKKLKTERNLPKEKSPVMTKHSVIDWDNLDELDVVLLDELEHNIDNDATKEISLVTEN
ncbi:Uncharacterized protein FWK35_00028195, partial [Aphis craccivora]